MTKKAPAPFADRFALAVFPTGGVIVDLESGNYFRLNPSAAHVCQAVRDSTDATAARERVARELAVPGEEAQRLIDDLQADLRAAPVRGTPQGSYRYLPDPDGYSLWHGERSVLRVDAAALTVSRARDTPLRRAEALEPYLRAVAVKLLFLRGVTILHASGCLCAARLIAFSGVSGAGKTTTARAFRDAGAQLVSEDLLVLDPEGRGADVLLDGERAVHGWAARAAVRLISEPDAPIPSTDLYAGLTGPRAPLAEVLFLDPVRRDGAGLRTRRLDGPDALLALMTNDFLGAVEPGAWRRYLQAATALSASTTLLEASAPAGVDHLVAAARAYMSSWTS